MRWYTWCLGWAALVLPAGVWAQASAPVGTGLQGAYYTGSDFEQYVTTRRDAAIDFDWNERRPVAGVGAEQFSVRWTGWLVPPTTGRYVLHVSADDGVRLWLNERELLSDWQSQGLYFYQLAVTLTAGQACAIRLEYCQRVSSARIRLAWKLPAAPASARNRRSAAAEEQVVVIPVRYLFTEAPHPTLAPVVATSPPLPPAPVSQAAPTSLLVVQPGAVEGARPRPRSYLPLVAGRASTPVGTGRVDSSRVVAVADRLAADKSVTLRALYFEQGQASLLPAVQASLDTLAQALVSRPTLRLEVQGHTDNQGDPAVNQRLSRQRAEAVCRYLSAHGVAAERLRAVGYGGSRPVADNSQPDQRFRNRRVVLKPLGR